MENENLILLDQFCSHHEIEVSFVFTLQQYGLIEILHQEDHRYLRQEELSELEKMIRLHFELGINMEGIDAVANLLKQIQELKQELRFSQTRLRLYE